MAEAIAQSATKKSSLSFADYAPTYGAAAALLLLILLNVFLTTNFADVNNFSNILVQVTPTMLVAIGMTFVIATGGIDLSVGSLMAIASAVAAISLDYGAFPAIFAGLVVVTLVGAFSGWLISTFKIQPIIVPDVPRINSFVSCETADDIFHIFFKARIFRRICQSLRAR